MRVSELIEQLHHIRVPSWSLAIGRCDVRDPQVVVKNQEGKWHSVISVHYAPEVGSNVVTFMLADDDLETHNQQEYEEQLRHLAGAETKAEKRLRQE